MVRQLTMSLTGNLEPTPEQARDWLSQELHRSDYRDPWLDSVIRWIGEQLSRLLDAAGNVAGLSPLITVLVALAVIGLLAWVLPRVRREPVLMTSGGAVLEDATITARRYRDLAARALREGRHDDAVLNGFRAIAKDTSDRALLDDAPSRTAHEVSLALARPFPGHIERLAMAANLFDAVRYGHQRADARQAGQVLDLDAELVVTRPVLATRPVPTAPPRQDQPV